MSQRTISPDALFNRTQAQQLEQLTDQEFWHYAAELAAHKTAPETSPAAAYLECEIGNNRVIVALASLIEVSTTTAHFTRLPASPPWMAGITTWHGEAIAVVDLAAFLTQSQARIQENRLLLIARHQSTTIGLYTTTNSCPLELSPEQIQPYDVNSVGTQHRSADAIQGQYQGALVLHIPTMLTMIVNQLQVNSFL